MTQQLFDYFRVLSRLSDIVLARVYGHSDIEEMASEASIPVVKYVHIYLIPQYIIIYLAFCTFVAT